eukprot:TRINITY_DN2883_c0_g2_i2.p1 TRINITY_DN2883_c0_g2~~TRINITY_DN2883_c0_g2_i2.p1  ORF type:complete len:252 (-),score=0.42 TRINITY_DN2883_c0_g2_i2:162-866(-)
MFLFSQTQVRQCWVVLAVHLKLVCEVGHTRVGFALPGKLFFGIVVQGNARKECGKSYQLCTRFGFQRNCQTGQKKMIRTQLVFLMLNGLQFFLNQYLVQVRQQVYLFMFVVLILQVHNNICLFMYGNVGDYYYQLYIFCDQVTMFSQVSLQSLVICGLLNVTYKHVAKMFLWQVIEWGIGGQMLNEYYVIWRCDFLWSMQDISRSGRGCVVYGTYAISGSLFVRVLGVGNDAVV